ncbi:MAG: beta-N-acetylglucosaminidase domain-containing protein [Selenomonadaceae bacterium]|nr:beta-N-acetylglucosaminidase domain-containing protein [Selenomonadaceae bacterium]
MKFLAMAAMILSAILTSTASAAPVPLRGVIEGFYGTPWNFEQRADLMKFCRTHNLNAYVYAPKDDPYHREKWREPYPAEKLAALKKLVSTANKNGVRFIFAVSPGLDLNYSGKKGEEDFALLMKKLDAVYNLGVRYFAIFFDDLKDDKGRHHEDGKRQADFLNKLQENLREKHFDVEPLLTVPTEYYRQDMLRNVNHYTEDFAANLAENIVVLYTGDGVVCDGISDAEFQAACEIYNRDLGIWWNYPVNDYTMTEGGNRNAKLALGAIEKLPARNVQAIFFNPMGQYELSKIALATGAVYANSPENYDTDKAWDNALSEQFGTLAPAMKIFALHSRHMENSWAKVGAADAPDFEDAALVAIANIRANRYTDFSALTAMIDDMERAADTLLKKLPRKILAECKPQLEQFKRIAQADRLAVKSLRTKSLDPNLKPLREEIAKFEPDAILSEKAALKFVDDTINLLDR